MYEQQHISVIIPVLDEESAIGIVVNELNALKNPDGERLIDDIIVCDNGSTDNSSGVAHTAGARVTYQPERGYGAACLLGIECLLDTDIVLFVDGDHSCVPEQAIGLIEEIHEGAALAIGSRSLGKEQAGSLTLPQKFGNKLSTLLIQMLWRQKVTDLGPFRAIKLSALKVLKMEDRRFGWTVEMQVKAIQLKMNVVEIPVDSLKRIGKSKISGTVSGVIGAGLGILGMIAKLWWREHCKTDEIYQKALNKA